jgi:putative inorganic carbon (HCO3(-)) transporter
MMYAATLRRNSPYACAALLGGAIGLVVARQPLVAVALIAATVGGLIVVTRPDLVLLVMIAALPWENKLHYPSASLSAVKGIGLVVMLSYLLRLAGDRRKMIYLPPLLGIVTALGVWISLSLVVSPNPSEGLQKLVRWALFFAFFFLVIQLVEGRPGIRRALRWFTASTAAAAIYALWLFVVARSGYRVAGPLQDPNDFAYLLACTLPIAGYLMSSDRQRAVWGVCFVVIAAAMLATFSRGALVGLGTLVVWAVLTRRVPIWVLTSSLITALVVAALAFTLWRPLLNTALHQKTHIAQSNTESRLAFWAAAIKLAEQRPLTGVGPERFPVEALPLLRNNPLNLPKPVTHNSYLEILSENGIPALLLFIAYLATAWGLLRQVQRRAARDKDDDERHLATALQASFIIAIVSATFLSEELTSPFWLLGGLAVVLARTGAGTPARPGVADERTPGVLPAGPPPSVADARTLT